MRFRRRTILIRPRIQLKLVLVFTGVSILALLLQYLMFISLATELAERMPSGGEYVIDALPGLSIHALAVSLAVLLPVSLAVGIAITFRVAGPVHKMERYLRDLAAGESLEPCRLRKGDELHDLCDAVNAVGERLRERDGAVHDDAESDGGRSLDEAFDGPVDGPPILRHPGRRGRAGISMIEALIVMMVLSIAMGMFATTVSSMASQRQINRESAVAAEAARVVLEHMRDRPFAAVYALYNAAPADDPGGAGSAPGASFAVPGLPQGVGTIVMPSLMTEPVGAVEGLVDDLLGGGGGGTGGTGGTGGGGGGLLGGGGGLLGGGGGGGGLLGGGGGGGGGLLGGVGDLVGGVGGLLDDVLDPEAEAFLAVREDYEDRRLGMPRDLNGDGVVDDRAHSHDYLILPVLVRVEWQGRLGPREFRLYSQLTAMER